MVRARAFAVIIPCSDSEPACCIQQPFVKILSFFISMQHFTKLLVLLYEQYRICLQP